jgi:DNA-binding transcriptional regulator/RsmH inhibitor MraZ
MLRLTRAQRVLLAETLRDLANLAAGAMVFGQFIGSETFSRWTMVGGAATWIAFVRLAVSLVKEKP